MKKIITIALALTLSASAWAQSTSKTPENLKAKANAMMQKGKLTFIANKGQVKDSRGETRNDILYTARGGNVNVYFFKDKVSYVFAQKADENKDLIGTKKKITDSDANKSRTVYRMDMEIIGGNAKTSVSASEATATTYNYATTGREIQTQGFENLTYSEVYPNIDLVFHSTETGIKYEYIVRPGGNPKDIKFRYDGADKIALEGGQLNITNPLGTLKEEAPYSFIAGNGADIKKDAITAKVVASSYELKNGVVSYNIEEYDSKSTLVIDPNVVWATYHGGMRIGGPFSDNDVATSVTAATNGYIVAVGYTESTVFPVDNEFQTFIGGQEDVFAVCFTANGVVRWATYYGGEDNERALGVTMGSGDYIGITGWTESTNFYVPGAFQSFNASSFPTYERDAFVLCFSLFGGTPYWGTYYGGDDDDEGHDIAYMSGIFPNFCVTGVTKSSNLITVNPLQGALGGGEDAFYLLTVESNGIHTASSYLGGDANEGGMGIVANGLSAISGHPEVVISGYAQAGYPYTVYPPLVGYDGFVARLDSLIIGGPLGTRLRFWNFYGGTASDTANDLCYTSNKTKVAFVGTSNSFAFIGGGTNASPFGTTDVMMKVLDLSTNGFISSGRGLYGGTGNDYGNDIVKGANDVLYITGSTNSLDFPLNEPFQRNLTSTRDAFFAQFEPTFTMPNWSSYYGAGTALIPSETDGNGITLTTDGTNRMVIVGASKDGQLPLRPASAFQSFQYPGQWDPFVAVFEDRSAFPTYLGSDSADAATDVAYSSNDNSIVVTGYTDNGSMTFFPATAGAHQTTYGTARDAFLTKYDANGNMVWSTFYGDSGIDVANGVAVDIWGNIAIAGSTTSLYGIAGSVTGYSVDQSAFYPPQTTGADAFLAKFNILGQRLFGTYMGGDFNDEGMDVAFDGNGNMIMVGLASSQINITSSTGFDLLYNSGFLSQFGLPDAFVVKYDSAGVRQWGSYAGGGDVDIANGVATDASGDIYVVGETRSIGTTQNIKFPDHGGFTQNSILTYASPIPNNIPNGFIIKFSSGGGSPWSILDGNSVGSIARSNIARDVAVSGNNIFLTGYADATNLEWGGTSCTGCNNAYTVGRYDAFVSKYFSTGGRLDSRLYGTPSTNDMADAITISNGEVLISGLTTSRTLPGTADDATFASATGNQDAFVTEFSSGLTAHENFYYGGGSNDAATGIAVQSNDKIFICGTTFSNAPTPILGDLVFASDPSYNGLMDAFITKISRGLNGLARSRADLAEETPVKKPVAGPGVEFSVSPNPAKDRVTVQSYFSQDTPVAITITDVLGREYISSHSTGKSGDFSQELDISDLASGSYIVNFTFGSERVSAIIIKQ